MSKSQIYVIIPTPYTFITYAFQQVTFVMTREQETELIKRIYKGDPQVENELFSQFDSRIVRKVRFSIGMNNEDWQDVVSEIQVAMLNNLREGKFDVARGVSLGTYVFGITMNKIRDYFKFRKKQEII